jgi:hypothetical protein
MYCPDNFYLSEQYFGFDSQAEARFHKSKTGPPRKKPRVRTVIQRDGRLKID